MLESTDYIQTKGRDRVIEGITSERILRSLNARAKHQLGRLGIVRSLVSMGYRNKNDIHSKLFPDISVEAVYDAVSKDGIYQGLKLQKNILKELVDFAWNTPVFGNRKSIYGFKINDFEKAQVSTGKVFTLASYFNIYEQCPAVRQIANDPLMREVAYRYIGPMAKHLGCNMWWSYPCKTTEHNIQNEYAQLFHYDLDDYKFMKVFFYLTDVDKESGPHVFVRGTHYRKPWRHIYPMRRLEDLEIEKTYAQKDILCLEGKAGEGFAEDTFGIHKGATPTKKSRLILQLYYGISQGYTDDRHDPAQLKMIDV